MKRSLVLSGFLILLLACISMSAHALSSGLQAGEKTPTFNALDVTGAHAGHSFCYV